MAVQDWTTSAYAGNYGQVRKTEHGSVIRRRYIDTSTNNMTSGDIYKVLAYPANTIIRNAWMVTETVEGAAETADLLDDSSATTTLVNNHDLNTDNTINAASNVPVFKTSAEAISVRADAALTAAKFWVCAEFIQVDTND